MDTKIIKNRIQQSISIKELLLLDVNLINTIQKISIDCINAFNNGNSVYFCGNGGSASDAQHLAAELSGRYYFDRRPLASEALHTNSSYMTAVANDYGYEHVYSRLIEGIGREGDILFGISTSGNSQNIVNAIIQANKMNIHTIGMVGSKICKITDVANITIHIPSEDTPRIQEAHILIGHIICELIEMKMFYHEI